MSLHIFPQRLPNKQVKKKKNPAIEPYKKAQTGAAFLTVSRVPNHLDPLQSKTKLYLELLQTVAT